MFGLMICPLKRLYLLAEDGDMSDVAVLAVSSYDIDMDKLTPFSHKLCLSFDDVTHTTVASAFSAETAERIADYVRGLPGDLDTLFVCCDSGESRSTAMAAAITRYMGLDDLYIWKNPRYHPNTLVYTLLCSALGVQVSEEGVADKKKLNERALSDAIHG